MKTIFLDIDGVLNTDASFMLSDKLIDRNCFEFFVDAVLEIKRYIPIRIVISSSWRKCTYEYFVAKITENVDYKVQEFCECLAVDWKTNILSDRNEEIRQYCKSYYVAETDYICIDDEPLELPCIPVISAFGFGYTEAMLLKNILLKDIRPRLIYFNDKIKEDLISEVKQREVIIKQQLKLLKKYEDKEK
jgi:hypothetical protein